MCSWLSAITVGHSSLSGGPTPLQGGNNNTYCHDSPLNWFNWEKAAADTKGFARYFQCLVNFRYGACSTHLLRKRFCASSGGLLSSVLQLSCNCLGLCSVLMEASRRC